jgi:hypothetical protein
MFRYDPVGPKYVYIHIRIYTCFPAEPVSSMFLSEFLYIVMQKIEDKTGHYSVPDFPIM